MPPKQTNRPADTNNVENESNSSNTSQRSPHASVSRRGKSSSYVLFKSLNETNQRTLGLINALADRLVNSNGDANAMAALVNAPTDNRLEASNKDGALMKNENAALTSIIGKVITLALPSTRVINRDTVVPEDPYDENDGSTQAPQGTPASSLIVRAVRSKQVYGLALLASDPDLNRDFHTAVQDLAEKIKADRAYARLPDDELYAFCALLISNNRQLRSQSRFANDRGAIRFMTLHLFSPTSDLSINDPTVNPLAIYTGFETWAINLLAILIGFLLVSGASGSGSSTDAFGYDHSRVAKTLQAVEPLIGSYYSSVHCTFYGKDMSSLLALSGALRVAGNIGSNYASASSKAVLSLSAKPDSACKSLFALAGLALRSAVRTARSDAVDATEHAPPANNANAANRDASAPATVDANRNTASTNRERKSFSAAAAKLLHHGVDYGKGFVRQLAEHLSSTNSTERPSIDTWLGGHMRRCEELPRGARPPRHNDGARGGRRRDRDGRRKQGRGNLGPVLGNIPDTSAPATTGGARS